MKPDATAVIQQLLLSYHATSRWHLFRSMWLGQGGYALLRAAGFPSGRARAVNLMAARTARRWKAEGVALTPGLVLDESRRLAA